MKLLDTSIFVYAQGRAHVYYEPCRALVASLETGPSRFTIDAELLQEVLHVYTARGERSRAFRTVDRLKLLFPEPIPISGETVVDARRLMEAHPALSPRDAIHAAVVIGHGLEGIVTTDQGFAGVTGVTAFDPREVAAGA